MSKKKLWAGVLAGVVLCFLFSSVAFANPNGQTLPDLPPVNKVPEPWTMILLGFGLLGLAAGFGRRFIK